MRAMQDVRDETISGILSEVDSAKSGQLHFEYVPSLQMPLALRADTRLTLAGSSSTSAPASRMRA